MAEPFPETCPERLLAAPEDPAEAAELDALVEQARSFTGWLSERQGRALHHLARRSPGAVLEIGSFCGRSTVHLALGARQAGVACHAVDPHLAIGEGGKEQYDPDFSPRATGTWDEFHGNLGRAGMAEVVTSHRASSEEARRDLGHLALGLLFIDGSHEYLDVVLDHYLWQDLVVPGGHLAIHDSNHPEVSAAITNHLDRSRWEHVATVEPGGWALTVWRC